MDIGTALAGLKTSIEVSKTIGELLKQPDVDRNEVRNRLMVIQQYILESQAALIEARGDQQKLKEQLAVAEQNRDLEADLEWVTDGLFFVRKSEREKGAIPYCPICIRKDFKAVPLTMGEHPGILVCTLHKTQHFTHEYEEWQKKNTVKAACASSDPPPRRSIFGFDRDF